LERGAVRRDVDQPGRKRSGERRRHPGTLRVTDFVHAETDTKICCQIGHSGRKGSTQVGWENMGAPLVHDNWPLVSASAIAWSPNNAVPREVSRGGRRGPATGMRLGRSPTRRVAIRCGDWPIEKQP